MTGIQPATTAGQIIDEINARLERGLPLQEEDAFWLRRLEREAKKLMSADPAEAHVVLAGLAQLNWDEAKAREHIGVARHILASSWTALQHATLVSNFGYCSESIPLLDDALSPENGYFAEFHGLLCSVGAFQKLTVFLLRAKTMNLDLNSLSVETYEKAGNILLSAGVTDEVAAAAFDVVGQMLRERRLFAVGNPDIGIDDDFGHLPAVFVTFAVRVAPDVAADMTFELCERLISKNPRMSASLNIGFRSAGAA